MVVVRQRESGGVISQIVDLTPIEVCRQAQFNSNVEVILRHIQGGFAVKSLKMAQNKV